MKRVLCILLLAPGLLLICCLSACKSSIDKDIVGTWIVSLPETEEAAKELRGFKGKDPKEVEAAMEELKRLAEKLVLSFDKQYFAFQSGSVVTRASYSVKMVDGNHLVFITDVDGKPGNGSATLNSGKLQAKFGGDYDFIIWRRSETTTSALSPDYYRPPEKDKNGRFPEDVVRIIYKSLESGDTADVSKHLSAPFLRELETGSRFHKSVEAFMADLNNNGERRLKTVEKTRFMIGKKGLWNVAYTLADQKESEIGMGQYFRLIEDEWKMVSRFTEQ